MHSHENTSPSRPRPSVAVLYFPTGDADRDLSHIACGLTEDVISRLGQASGLSVSSRHDVIALRNREVDAEEVGRCLDVGSVLRGEVRALDGRIRLTVWLRETCGSDDSWRGTFDRPATEVFDLPLGVALGVVRALGAALAPDEERRMSTRLTRDAAAYEFHARGRESLTRRGRKHTESAISLFERAVAADPGFAVAHESMAAAFSGMFTYYDGDKVWLDRMAASARTALEIDTSLVDARFHLGMVSLHTKKYGDARAAFEEIIRMRPSYYEAYQWLGILSDMTGDYDGALEWYHKSAQIKTCSVEPWLYINMTHRRRGDLAAATEAARRFLEVGLKTLQIIPDDPVTLSRFCVVYTLFGEKDKARETLERVLRTGTEDGLVLYNCAATYALLGDRAQSLACLRRALSGGYKNVREWIETDPDFDPVREGPDFNSLLVEFDRRHEFGGRLGT